MAHQITKQCGASGLCIQCCPTEAILHDAETNRYWIDEEACVDCGDCAEICPSQAIIGPEVGQGMA